MLAAFLCISHFDFCFSLNWYYPNYNTFLLVHKCVPILPCGLHLWAVVYFNVSWSALASKNIVHLGEFAIWQVEVSTYAYCNMLFSSSKFLSKNVCVKQFSYQPDCTNNCFTKDFSYAHRCACLNTAPRIRQCKVPQWSWQYYTHCFNTIL